MSRFAVIGDPIAHSKSPAMHAAAYRALGMDHTYEAIRVTADELPAVVQRLRDGDLDGLNVTVPHKVRVLDHVDSVDLLAKHVGAANTLVRSREGRVVAHNTDVTALANELCRLAPERESIEAWMGASALVLGSGGAARSAIAALQSMGVGRIHVAARRGEKILGLETEPLAPSAARDRALGVIVQCTSAGMRGADPGDDVARAVAWADVPKDAVALDVVYAPPETPFLALARGRGLRASNGLGMLALQGLLAFARWLEAAGTKLDPKDLDRARTAMEAAIA